MNNNTCREECWSAISKSYEAIGMFMASIKPDSNNYVGGIERLHLEEALSECRKALETLNNDVSGPSDGSAPVPG